jgi:hypothetical protein
MKDSLIEEDYHAIFDDDNPLQFVSTNTRTTTTAKTRTTETTRTHAEFIRNTTLNTEDFPLAQIAQPTPRRQKRTSTIAYSFKDALTTDTTNNKTQQQQQPTPTTKKQL